MDLRQVGRPFEKKFIQFSDEHIQEIIKTYHNWQLKDTDYEDVQNSVILRILKRLEKRLFTCTK